MHIQKVKGNVKKGCDVELGEKTLVVGPNGSGKSTIVNTIELALTGRVGDVAGRVDIAREADVMGLAKDGAPMIEALAEFSDGSTAAYRTSGSTAKAKKAVSAVPAAAQHDEVLPIRTLREAVLGSPQTARKYLMSKVSTATYADIEAMIPGALAAQFKSCFPVNVPVADGLVAAIEYAGKQARDASSEAKTQREAAKLVSGGRGAPPSDAEVRQAQATLKGARDALKAMELADGAAEELAAAEEYRQALEESAEEDALALEKARAAFAAAKKPAAVNPLLSHVCFVMDESVLAGECLCCGATAPTKAMADEVSAAIADSVKANEAYRDLEENVLVAEAHAEKAISELEKAEAKVAAIKAKVGTPVTPLDLLSAETEVATAEQKVLDLKASRDSWLKVQQAESAALDADRRGAEWKALKESLESAMAMTLEQSLAGFVAKVQAFLPASDVFDLKLRDGEREVVSFGLVRDGYLHTALSGAEWARVTAAMASACAGNRFAVVIPEERAFDPATLKEVLVALGNSPHQVILTSPVKPKSVPKGWTVIER